MKVIAASFLILLSLQAQAFCREFSKPSVVDQERIVYRTILKKTKKELWRSVQNLEVEKQKSGLEIVHVKESGFGNYQALDEPISWEIDASFTLESPPRVLGLSRRAVSEDGKEIWKKNKIFDYANKKLTGQQFSSEELTKEKSLSFPKGSIFIGDILSMLLRGYDFDSKKTAQFHLFSSDAALYKIKTKIIKTETVQVPAGNFECYKMRLFLTLGLADLLVGYFLPKTYLWFTVKEPHFWVKYEGLESGQGSPYVIMELVEFQRQ